MIVNTKNIHELIAELDNYLAQPFSARETCPNNELFGQLDKFYGVVKEANNYILYLVEMARLSDGVTIELCYADRSYFPDEVKVGDMISFWATPCPPFEANRPGVPLYGIFNVKIVCREGDDLDVDEYVYWSEDKRA
ncbi:MAG: hypothetical protein H6641_18400 [Caldilineaceae bacterium]|nr:hypothetical protein [Caldilineaceae bacterium]